MNDASKHSLLVNYGPRELEIFNAILEDWRRETNVSNRNEIIRRGIHSFLNTIQTDDHCLLSVLSSNLKILMKNYDESRFNFAKNLALMSYSVLICKRGVSESELFELIVSNMLHIDEYKKKYPMNEDTLKYIVKMLDYMTKSIDLIFLKEIPDLDSNLKLLESYYSGQSNDGLAADPNSKPPHFETIRIVSDIGSSSLILPISYGVTTVGDEFVQEVRATNTPTIIEKARKKITA